MTENQEEWLDVMRSSPPSVIPLSEGGLQLEWHTGGWDIEVEVEAVDYARRAVQ